MYSLHQFDTDGPFVQGESVPVKQSDSIISIQDRKFSTVAYPYTERPVYLNNRVYFILAKRGDSFYDIAIDVQLTIGQIRKYNDISSRKYEFSEGEIVYISSKAEYSEKYKEHSIRRNETLRDIAQYYGVTEKSLRKLNRFTKDSKIVPGYIIRLR